MIEDEAALRLIAVPVLGRRRQDEVSTASLPPLSRVREIIGSTEFSVSDTIDFERVYVLKGAVVQGMKPGDALEALRRRMVDNGYGESTELFLQKSKEGDGKSVMFMMLKEDLPKDEFAWWQWLICVLLFIFTVASVNITPFAVTTVSQNAASAMDLDTMVRIAGKTVPTGISIFLTVSAMEVARRVAASNYGVSLTPPFFIPVWPFPSIGSFGAITRRMGTVPNNEAAVGMAVAAGLTGFAVSLAIIAYGLSLGPDPDKFVNLNFQLLPLALKLLLKPLLGQSSVSDQPDPFQDPINIAFPANGVTIGGAVALIVVALNMLPIGRLDGGIIAKSALGSRTGSFLGFLALAVLLLGTAAPGDAGMLCITFGFYAIIFQNGTENPPRDAVSEPNDALKAIGLILIAAGTIVAVPGSFLPGI